MLFRRSRDSFGRALLAGCLSFVAANTVWAQQSGTTGTAAQETLKEVQLAKDQFSRGAPLPAWVEKVSALPDTQNKASTVLRLADTQLTASPIQSYYVHRVIKVNDAAGLQQNGQYAIAFQANYQQVQLHFLRILRGNAVLDKTTTASTRFLQREAGLEQGLYNGEVTASILIDDLRVGDSIEIAYTTLGANPVLGRTYVQTTSWDQGVPTELRRVTLYSPVDRKIEWRFMGDLNRNFPQPMTSVAAGVRKLQWLERDMPVVQVEQYVPNAFNVGRYLEFSEFSSWADVADWGVQLFKSTAPLPDELQQQVARLRTKTSTDEQVSGALAWVQSEIRYFSVSLGESSHRPHQPAETLKNRYGDCKDKTFLLIELLRGLGIEAQPVLVSARNRTGIKKQLPTPYAFDHAIVRVQVGAKTYFLDPTRQGQGGKLDKMGQPHERNEVLVLQAGNNSLSTITTPNIAELTWEELTEKITIPKFDAESILEARQTFSGEAAEYMRLLVSYYPREQLEKGLMEAYEKRYPGIERAAPMVVEDDALNNVVTVIRKYKSSKLALQTTAGSGDWRVRFATSNLQGMLAASAIATRTQPLVLPAVPHMRQYKLELEFPAEVSANYDPQTRFVRNAAFEYDESVSFRGNRANASIILRTLATQVEADKVAAYMEDLRKVDDISIRAFTVVKSNIKSTGLFGLGGPKTLTQTIIDRLTDEAAQVSKTINSGKISGDDLAEAYCTRANALSDIGKGEESLKDAQLAVKTAPNLASAYHCRADTYYMLGDLPRSIADYSKAIALSGAGKPPYKARGRARFYNGQIQAAADDFEKATKLGKSDTEEALYAELWRLMAQKRLGQTPDANQLKLASANPRGDWPRPALAMLHGLITPDELLKSLEGKQGDEKTMALVEGYFYTGQHYLAQGDKVKATAYFKKTRELGVINYEEHLASAYELQQLGGKP